MARNKVMKLWTAVVTAFLALCTALGLITTAATTASAAVPQTEPARNSESRPSVAEQAPLLWALLSALPPTMKQRIHAEAHGTSPSCRHRLLPDPAPEPGTENCSDSTTTPTESQPADAPQRN
ncbi:DUF6344 domain-containing protein [Streptomyces capillispiralis]|uniref:DUF6344 domain-containing protein n=1 Tax=Streptomyces capillispiralis TaxID=68182 RepID=UPI0036B74D18